MKKITQQVSFDDPYYFSRVLSQFMGLSSRQLGTVDKSPTQAGGAVNSPEARLNRLGAGDEWVTNSFSSSP